MAAVRKSLQILCTNDLAGTNAFQLEPFIGSKLEAKVLDAQKAVLNSTAQVQDYFKNALLANNQPLAEQDDSGLTVPLDQLRSELANLSHSDDQTVKNQAEDFEIVDYSRYFTPEELNLPVDSFLLPHPTMDPDGSWAPEEMDRLVTDMSWPPLFGELDWDLDESEAKIMTAEALKAELDQFYGPDPSDTSSAADTPTSITNQKTQFSSAPIEGDIDTIMDEAQASQDMLTTSRTPIQQDLGGNWVFAGSPATLQHGIGDDSASTFEFTGWEKVLEKTDEDIEYEKQARHQYLLSQDGEFGFEDLLPNPKDATANLPGAPPNAINTHSVDVANNSPSFQRVMDNLWATYDSHSTKTPKEKVAELRKILDDGKAVDSAKEKSTLPSRSSGKPSTARLTPSQVLQDWQDERERKSDLVDRLVNYQKPEGSTNKTSTAKKTPTIAARPKGPTKEKGNAVIAARPKGPTKERGNFSKSHQGPSKSVSFQSSLCSIFSSNSSIRPRRRKPKMSSRPWRQRSKTMVTRWISMDRCAMSTDYLRCWHLQLVCFRSRT